MNYKSKIDERIITAIQFDGKNLEEIKEFIKSNNMFEIIDAYISPGDSNHLSFDISFGIEKGSHGESIDINDWLGKGIGEEENPSNFLLLRNKYFMENYEIYTIINYKE